jgi:hypothetical protein
VPPTGESGHFFFDHGSERRRRQKQHSQNAEHGNGYKELNHGETHGVQGGLKPILDCALQYSSRV